MPTLPKSPFLKLFVFVVAPVLCALTFLPAQESKSQLQAGAATSNITLPLGGRNGGVIARGGIAKNIHDELRVRCLVLDDGETKIAIAVCDLRMIIREVIDSAKVLVTEATGISGENILISATHTHGAPGVIGMHTDEIDQWYQNFLIKRIADGIIRSHENRAPARIAHPQEWGGAWDRFRDKFSTGAGS